MVLFSELQFDPENPIPRREEDDVERLYFDIEKSFMAPKGYAKDSTVAKLRDRAGFVIAAQAASERFDPFVPYLALNYFDRSISITRNEPQSVDFIAVSCLTLAWKMRDLTFTIPQFLAERPDLAGYTTELVASMEYRIIQELDWRLRPVLAVCYVPYFAAKLETEHGISQETIREILIYAQLEIFFTRFRPSVLAAAALLSACDFLYPDMVVHYFLELASLPILRKRKTSIQKCMEGLILRCHDLKLLIKSSDTENENQLTLQLRAGPAFRQGQAGEDESSMWNKGKGKAGESVEIEESEEESKDEEISLRRTTQSAQDLEITAINENKGKGVKIVEREESKEARDAKIAAVSKDKGKGVKIEESEEEEESEDEQFSLRRNRQRPPYEKIAPINKEKAGSNSEELIQEAAIDEGNPSNEQETQEAVINEENPRNEAVIDEENSSNEAVIDEESSSNEAVIDEDKPSNKAVIDEGNPSNQAAIDEENPSNEQQTQDTVIDKGNAAHLDQTLGRLSELDTDSDSSACSVNLDIPIEQRFRGLQLSKERLERVRHLLEQSGTESETDKDSDEAEPHVEKGKKSTRVEVIKEEPIPELEEAAEEGSGTDLLKFPQNVSEAEAEEGSGSDLFTLVGVGIPTVNRSSEDVSEARGGGKVDLQRAELRPSAQDVGVSGELREPLINLDRGSDSEEEPDLEAAEGASESGGPRRRRRTPRGYCSGCSCSLL